MKQTNKKERATVCKEEIQNNGTRGLTSTAARGTLSQDTLRFGLVPEGSVS